MLAPPLPKNRVEANRGASYSWRMSGQCYSLNIGAISKGALDKYGQYNKSASGPAGANMLAAQFGLVVRQIALINVSVLAPLFFNWTCP
jgi:hypothetical protein